MNITLKRWLTIIVYGSLSAFLIKAFIQVDWVQELVSWCTNAFDLFGVYPQKLFLILLGFLLYQFLLKMNIYSKKGSFKTWWFYPPITFVALPFIVFALILFFDELQFKNISWNQVFNVVSLMAFITGKSICDFRSLSKSQVLKKNDGKENNQDNRGPIKSKSTYGDYKEWFKDDEPISEKYQLSPDLIHYVDRISSRINKDNKAKKSIHISLVGNFGAGKSSIIKCVEKELEPEFIYCNIDTWAATPKSINAFVLSKVIESVSEYVDMSSFKSLPSEYIDALKLGNNASKLLAIFSGVTIDPLNGLTQLNSLLGAINKKLLITIQDVDRSADAQKTINELASLLDKLKGQSDINFIIALGYDSQISETISKVCDYREDLIKADHKAEFESFIGILNERAIDRGFVIPNKTKHSKVGLRSFNPYSIIRSLRSFKHICRRVDSIWKSNKLMGEIDLQSMFLMIALREEYPLVFDSIVKNSNSLFNAIHSKDERLLEKYELGSDLINQNKVDNDIIILNECAEFYPSLKIDKLTNFLQYLLERELSAYQVLFYKDSKQPQYCDYLNRLLLEKVPDNEVNAQSIFSLFAKISHGDKTIDILIKLFQSDDKGSNWIEAYTRFSRDYFKPTDKNVYKAIYIKMVNFYYKDAIKHEQYSKRLINISEVQVFLTLLLKECLTNENAEELFNITLNIPTIMYFYTYFDVESVSKRENSCLDLFLNKKEGDNLYGIFVTKLKFDNEITKQLFITDSMNQSLEWIAKTIINRYREASKKVELWKEIIFALIEVNNKTDENYQFDLWFICYVLDSYDFLNKEVFTSNEFESIKSSLKQLNVDDIRKNDLQLSNPKEIYQRVLSMLESYE